MIMGLQGHFQNNPITIDKDTKMQLMKMKKTPKLNIYEQQFNKPISEISIKRINWRYRSFEIGKNEFPQ